MKKLQLSLKTQWFNLTKEGVKTEDYREINEYYFKRLFRTKEYEEIGEAINGMKQGKSVESVGEWHLYFLKPFTHNVMTLGYPSKTDTSRIITFEHAGIEIRTGNQLWGAEPDKLYFVIKHGKQIS